MRKILLCLTALTLTSCGTGLPPPPEVLQCVYTGSPRAFYCVNTRTRQRVTYSADASEMKAAQCMSADDYKKSEVYVKSLIDLIRTQRK